MKPKVERLRELFELADDGSLTWRVSTTKKVPAGSPAGTKETSGYVRIQVDGKCFRAHQIVFAMVHGRWAEKHVDHIDRNRSNNAPMNLREVSHNDNQKNRNVRKDNTSGFPGVTFDKRRKEWRAKLQLEGKSLWLGAYQAFRDAAEAYVLASLDYFGEMSPFWIKHSTFAGSPPLLHSTSRSI